MGFDGLNDIALSVPSRGYVHRDHLLSESRRHNLLAVEAEQRHASILRNVTRFPRRFGSAT